MDRCEKRSEKHSEKYCENNEDSIPTGNLIDVINTKFDFINHKNISSKLLKSIFSFFKSSIEFILCCPLPS